MYPFVRMAKELARSRKMPALGMMETHLSRHTCWPWDLDLWLELNNGRTLTLFDLGRIPLVKRVGLSKTLTGNGLRMAVAGVSVRYRKRIRLFRTVQMRSRILGWDDRFVYVDQTMWNSAGECTTQGLMRMAITDRNGIVPPTEVSKAIGHSELAPDLPDWVQAWIAADQTRPWPPEKI